jgi:hypothetical protein
LVRARIERGRRKTKEDERKRKRKKRKRKRKERKARNELWRSAALRSSFSFSLL